MLWRHKNGFFKNDFIQSLPLQENVKVNVKGTKLSDIG